MNNANAIRLSDRQYCQLQAIRDHPRSIVRSSELESYNQLTLGGNKRRGFVVETPSKDGIVLTQEGWAALEQFAHADFLRRVASTRFSSFLDLETASVAREKRTKEKQAQRRQQAESQTGRRRRVA